MGISGQSLILGANAPNLGSMYVLLKDFAERRDARICRPTPSPRQSASAASEEVRGAIVSAFGALPIDGLGTTGGFKIIVEDRGNLGLGELQRVSDQIVAQGNETPGLQGLFNSSRANTPWLYLDIDRTKCMALGVQVSDVFNTLQIYLGSFYVNNFNEFGRTWQVNVQADQHFRNKVPDIRQLQVRNNQGQMIRLGSLMDVRDVSGPVMVMRYNMYSATAITGNTAAGHQLGRGHRPDAGNRRQATAAVDGLRLDRTDATCNCRRATWRSTSSPWAWCSCSWCWRRSTKAGRCRWP